MNNTNLTEYRGFKVGQILTEKIGTNRTKLILVKGIFTDENNIHHLGMQYIDIKASKQNKRTTVSSKSHFWFEKI